MMETKKEILDELSRIYASLPEPTPPKKGLVITIASECGCSITTAYNWVHGKTMPEDSAKIEKIKEIIRKYNDGKP